MTKEHDAFSGTREQLPLNVQGVFKIVEELESLCLLVGEFEGAACARNTKLPKKRSNYKTAESEEVALQARIEKVKLEAKIAERKQYMKKLDKKKCSWRRIIA